MFQYQYEISSYELCDVCRGLIFKRHKGFCGGIEGIRDEPYSDRSFGMKWHSMAEPAMNDWLMKGTVRNVEMLMVSNVFQHYELMFTSNIWHVLRLCCPGSPRQYEFF